jgi:hypothetical protein
MVGSIGRSLRYATSPIDERNYERIEETEETEELALLMVSGMPLT